MQRCTNCGKYPFCNYIIDPAIKNECDLWTKREYFIKKESDIICINQLEKQVENKKNK